MNYMELFHHFSFFYLAVLKAKDMNKTLMPPAKEVGTQILLVNSLVSMSAFTKLFTFFRAIPSMAKMVILITQVVYDLIPFIVIYGLVILQQVVSYSLVGAQMFKAGDDYTSF